MAILSYILSFTARPCEREEGKRKERKDELREWKNKSLDLKGQNISKGAEKVTRGSDMH